MTSNHQEGYIDVGPGKVWFEQSGNGPPLLLLHGGPGAESGYLQPLMRFADDGYAVVRYDQLGSARSDKPDDPSLWTVDRFVDGLESVRTELGLDDVHLLGQSWGAFLALEYAIHHQEHLRSLILYSGAASTRQCFDGMLALRSALSPDQLAILDQHEAAGTTDDPDYLAVIDILLRRHLCRLNPWPELLTESMRKMAKPVYNKMWGPNEFTCTGTLMDWDRRDRLDEFTTPTLIVCGAYDEVIPECSLTLHEGIGGSEFVQFEKSSHLAHLEEPDRFFTVLRSFLGRVPMD